MKASVRTCQSAPSVYLLFLILCLMVSVHAQRSAVTTVPDAGSFNNWLAAAPLLFTENKGQVTDKAGHPRPDVLFTAHSAGMKIYLTATGIHYQFERTILPEGYEPDERKVREREKQEALQKQIVTQTSRFTLSLKGANPAPRIRREARNEYTENFYLATCAVTGVHTYERLVYENVYPGIDWVIYSKNQHLEHDFIVHPGADPAIIKLKVTDAQKISIAADGGLVVKTELGEVKEAAPVSYCDNGKISTSFNQKTDGTIGFVISTWDKRKELRIDPYITWATYYGAGGDDGGRSCATDASGNIYFTATTNSVSNIASGGFQNTFGGGYQDIFLVKFSSSGVRLWATYYGGSENDAAALCFIDASNNIYLIGNTGSASGISSGGFQNTYGGGVYDALIIKFDSNGQRLWATYYGGSGIEVGYSCVADATGNLYIAGYTASASGISSGGFQNVFGGGSQDAFLVKFTSDGVRLWGTYYGGDGDDASYCCSIDASGNIYLTGNTNSTSNFASGGIQNTFGGGYQDAFLVKFNSGGTRLWATYYGASGNESGFSCTTDPSGNVYVAGYTNSTTGVASGGFQNTFGGVSDILLVKFNNNGARIWGTYYGGSGDENATSCITDPSGNLYLTGSTTSASNIASGGFQNTLAGGYDILLAKFGSNGSRLWATYYGSTNDDYGNFCSVQASGDIYLAGVSASGSGMAFGGFQNNFGGSYDALLAKLNGSATSSFVSVANGNWNNPAVWSGSLVPTAGSIVFINTAVTVTANTSCYSLKVNPSGSLKVNSGISLNVSH